jgi:hypothetical protein
VGAVALPTMSGLTNDGALAMVRCSTRVTVNPACSMEVSFDLGHLPVVGEGEQLAPQAHGCLVSSSFDL